MSSKRRRGGDKNPLVAVLETVGGRVLSDEKQPLKPGERLGGASRGRKQRHFAIPKDVQPAAYADAVRQVLGSAWQVS